MSKKEMAARPETTATTSDVHPDDIAKTTKIATILGLFVKGRSLNRFDAEAHHDHCLNSTVAALQDWGLIVDREWERVPCLGGRSTVRCKRYWLRNSPDNLAAARALLKMWEGRA
ncbi:hypothetical protein [Hydrogenophaga sp.]|uniref:hypothetical protein n=1 Tax=Hydrogenophaga sp. TaxID=1904254 RepID=UPI002CB7F5B1|nr:hypothetical protein [Hydrogenophaga sp.]HMP09194.1 hypothetical protein [Hydrogenophaga sp.]